MSPAFSVVAPPDRLDDGVAGAFPVGEQAHDVEAVAVAIPFIASASAMQA